MDSTIISIHWHDECQPVYSLHFQPRPARSRRLATAGGDNNVRVWRVKYSSSNDALQVTVEYLSTLRKHTQAVNAVRFDPSGCLLATASDDGLLLVWSLSPTVVVDFGHQDDEPVESWVVLQVHCANLEIYDLAWSPDSQYIIVSCMDNSSSIYNVAIDLKVCDLTTHSHYVQGVPWDPKNAFIASMSADRSLHVYSVDASSSALKVSNVLKADKTDQYPQLVSALDPQKPLEKRLAHLYYSETLQSFFRRLAFSPDGSLLLTPLGVFKRTDLTGTETEFSTESATLNTVYVYIRSGFDRPPIFHIPGLSKAAVAISFNRNLYHLSSSGSSAIALPYKMVFAVATQNSVLIYDTQQLQPLGVASNLNYQTITDITWEDDGQSLMVSSVEGFCSIVVFEKELFGPVYTEKVKASSSSDTDCVTNDNVTLVFSHVKAGLDSFISKTNDQSESPMLHPKSEENSEKLSQMHVNQPAVLPVTKETNFSEAKGASKKKRIVPTLVQDYK